MAFTEEILDCIETIVTKMKEVSSVNIYSKFLAFPSIARRINGKRYQNKISAFCIGSIMDIIKSTFDDGSSVCGILQPV